MTTIDTAAAREKILAAVRIVTTGGNPDAGSGVDLSVGPGIDSSGDLIGQFMSLARAEAATTERVGSLADVPAAVVQYLKAQKLPSRINVVAAGELRSLDWSAADSLVRDDGPLAADGDTVLTGCFAGIAEAGALVMLSAADHPSEYNFLAATHIAVVRREHVVPRFEDLWPKLRRDCADELPRMMNWIVGPSRTADLGVPSKLGAHGPARVHIIVAE